jgi:hypothetical protein
MFAMIRNLVRRGLGCRRGLRGVGVGGYGWGHWLFGEALVRPRLVLGVVARLGRRGLVSGHGFPRGILGRAFQVLIWLRGLGSTCFLVPRGRMQGVGIVECHQTWCMSFVAD